MLIELIIALLLGCAIGTFTGLIPGIHINLVGASLVTLSTGLLSSINPLYLITLITAMAITHTFVDFIPSIFLGCPDTDTELSVLPGHELLKKGYGQKAVALSCYGSLLAVIILIVVSVPSLFLISLTYESIKTIIPYLLILISLALILLEKKKSSAIFVFLLTGILGVIVLNLPENFLKEPLLPLLTGLFGSSMLLLSIKNKTALPQQKIIKIGFTKSFFRPLAGSLIASPLCSFLPGLGSGQAAIIGKVITKKTNLKERKGREEFMVLLGATNTFVMGFSFLSLYAISRTRTGAAMAIQEIIGPFNWKILALILTVILISGLISFFLTLFISKKISIKIEKTNYTLISFVTLIVLLGVVFFISGFFGLLVLGISTLTGLYCISLGVRRTNMMGCLLIPTILFYLF